MSNSSSAFQDLKKELFLFLIELGNDHANKLLEFYSTALQKRIEFETIDTGAFTNVTPFKGFYITIS